jgi:acyl carrier protein phosphodiesterase
MSARFLEGARRHQAIDAFTDFHPVAGRSRRRISDEYGRFAGILIDVFYDHVLALDWGRYCPQPLEEFTAEFYAAIRSCSLTLPDEARAAVERMIARDHLAYYREVAGIDMALRRISARLMARIGRPFALERAVTELTANLDGLAQDFAEFFPQLQRHVEADAKS